MVRVILRSCFFQFNFYALHIVGMGVRCGIFKVLIITVAKCWNFRHNLGAFSPDVSRSFPVDFFWQFLLVILWSSCRNRPLNWQIIVLNFDFFQIFILLNIEIWHRLMQRHSFGLVLFLNNLPTNTASWRLRTTVQLIFLLVKNRLLIDNFEFIQMQFLFAHFSPRPRCLFRSYFVPKHFEFFNSGLVLPLFASFWRFRPLFWLLRRRRFLLFLRWLRRPLFLHAQLDHVLLTQFSLLELLLSYWDVVNPHKLCKSMTPKIRIY